MTLIVPDFHISLFMLDIELVIMWNVPNVFLSKGTPMIVEMLFDDQKIFTFKCVLYKMHKIIIL